MKKLFAILSVLFVMGTTSVFAKTGFGLQGGAALGGGNSIGAGVTLKLDSLPCVLGIAVPSIDPMAVGVTGDWWIANKTFAKPLAYYYGVGLAGNVFIGDSASVGVGARAFAGINAFFIDGFLEFYLQAAWQPMIMITNGVHPELTNFPVDFGFRFWF